MRMPKMPQAMLECDEETKKFIEEFEDQYFTDGFFFHETRVLDAYGIIENVLYVIGKAGDYDQVYFIVKKKLDSGVVEKHEFEPYHLSGILTLIRLKSAMKRQSLTNEFEKLKDDLAMANKKVIDDKIKGIELYQGSRDEVITDLEAFHGIKVSLQPIDTGKPEKYIKAESEYWLRVAAYKAGANLVINCQPGSAMGTPVKIIKNENI